MGNQQQSGTNAQQAGPSGGRPAGAVGGGTRPAAAANDVNYTQSQANGVGTATQARKPAGSAIILNVYEPSKPQATMPGFGIFHTGIEFQGVEYFFAGGEGVSGTGVMTQTPQAMPAGGQWKFKQAIELGTVNVTRSEFEKVLQELKDAFPASTYDLIHRNCNHFTTAVAKRLGVYGKYPGWVNRAASWGSMFMAPPKHLQEAELPPPKESVFKTTTGHKLDGSTVEPKGKSKAKEESKKPEKDKNEAKTSSAGKASSAAAGKGGAPRKNPWADPTFVPPGMRKDPIVAGVMKAQEPAAAAAK